MRWKKGSELGGDLKPDRRWFYGFMVQKLLNCSKELHCCFLIALEQFPYTTTYHFHFIVKVVVNNMSNNSSSAPRMVLLCFNIQWGSHAGSVVSFHWWFLRICGTTRGTLRRWFHSTNAVRSLQGLTHFSSTFTEMLRSYTTIDCIQLIMFYGENPQSTPYGFMVQISYITPKIFFVIFNNLGDDLAALPPSFHWGCSKVWETSADGTYSLGL